MTDAAATSFGVSDKLIFTFKTQLADSTEYAMMGGNVTITFDHEAKTFAIIMNYN